jgi:transposase
MIIFFRKKLPISLGCGIITSMNSEEKTQFNDAKSLRKIVKKQKETLQKKEEILQKKDEIIAQQEQQIKHLEFKSEQLELQLRKALQQRFGRKADKIPDNQLSIFDEAEVTVPVEELEIKNEEITVPEHQRKKSGRKGLPKDLTRTVVEHDLKSEDKTCKCGTELCHITDIDSEQLEYIPAKVSVIVNRRKKYACKQCEETIKLAPLPKTAIPKSIATPSLLASILVAKFCDHLPLYRQEQIWIRHGIDIPRQTLSNWVQKCAALLAKIVDEMKNIIVASNYARADETTVQVLKEENRDPSTKSYMWIFMTGHKTNNHIVFEYHPTRGSEAATNFFSGFQGYLQTDGYSGYNAMRKTDGVTELGCMAHSRRKFTDVTKIVTKTGKAHEALKYIKLLYNIEDKVKECTDDERYQYRQEHSKSILDKFKIWLDKSINHVPPKNPLGQAINYTINHWAALTRYLDHGMLDIDNNWCENQIRPFALGRKNWLFMDNPKGALSASIIYSLVITAKANGLDPWQYLMDVLTKAPHCETDADYAKLIPISDYFK